MFYCLFILLTKITSISKNNSSRTFKLIQSEHFTSSSFPDEKTHFGRDKWVPNRAKREVHIRRLIYNLIHLLHRKAFVPGSLQHELINIRGTDFLPIESMEKSFYLLHFPIIKSSQKNWKPAPILPVDIPHIRYYGIFFINQIKQRRESKAQHLVTTPYVFLKPYPPTVP